jgi:hypothetical protein
MANEPTPDQLRDARVIVAAAIAAAGNMNSSVAWQHRVNSLIAPVGAMFGERSRQMQRALGMLNATVFTAQLAGFKIEESSTRLIVDLVHPVDKDHPDGLQHIRTERTDTAPGKAMAEKIGHAKSGDTLLCWKVLEEIASGPNAGRNASVLYHIEVLPDRKDSTPRAEGGGPVVRSAPEEQPGGTASSGAPSTKVATINEFEAFNTATEHLDGRTKAAFVASLREQELWPPSSATIDRILIEAGKVR